MRKTTVGFLGTLAVLAFAAPEVQAQTQFIIEPSYFLTNAKGTLNFGAAPAPIDIGLGGSDISYSGAVRTEVDWGEWAAHVDFSFMGVETMSSLTILDFGTATGIVDYNLLQVEGFVFRSIAGQPEGLEVYGGVRVGAIDSQLMYEGISGGSGSILKDHTWVEPVLGMKGSTTGNGKFFANLRADVGGFGLGTNFTFNTVGKIGYRVSDVFSLEAGGKYISTDYEDGNAALSEGFRYDVSNLGFLFGVGLTFGG